MKKAMPIIFAALLVSGCGTAGQQGQGEQPEEQVSTVEFPQLEQTVSEDIRNGKVYPQEESSGVSIEALEIQSQEGFIAMQVIEETLGGYEEVQKHTVMYFQNETTDHHKIGFHIGMKEDDTEFDKVFDALQQKVDEGEILAKYIHLHPIIYTEKELNDKLDELYAKLKFSYIGRSGGNFGMSISPVTNVVKIDHNMFTEENQQEIRELFGEWEVEFEQSGAMVPGPGEPLVILPDEEFTTEPQSGGEIITYADDTQIHTQNTHYEFKGAKDVKVGMRVDIEANGPIMESFPAQGSASFVTVYPNYKPQGAALSEFEVNAKALGQLTDEQKRESPLLSATTYDPQTKSWTVTFTREWEGKEPFKMSIKDK